LENLNKREDFCALNHLFQDDDNDDSTAAAADDDDDGSENNKTIWLTKK
jgi:hypothetical protein